MIICAYINEKFCTGILTLSCDHGIYHGPLAIRPKSHNQGIQMSPIYTYKAGRSCSRLPYVWQGSPNKLIKYIARWWWELLQHNMMKNASYFQNILLLLKIPAPVGFTNAGMLTRLIAVRSRL